MRKYYGLSIILGSHLHKYTGIGEHILSVELNPIYFNVVDRLPPETCAGMALVEKRGAHNGLSLLVAGFHVVWMSLRRYRPRMAKC